jgi:hypothetical protein
VVLLTQLEYVDIPLGDAGWRRCTGTCQVLHWGGIVVGRPQGTLESKQSDHKGYLSMLFNITGITD